GVVGADRREACHRLLGGREGMEPGAGWNVRGEAGLLHDDRLTAGEIRGAAGAEPAAAEAHVGVLRDRALAPRREDVVLVGPHGGGDLARLDDAPARGGDLLARGASREGHLERLRRPAGKTEEAEELDVLATIHAAAEDRWRRLDLPRHDGREGAV